MLVMAEYRFLLYPSIDTFGYFGMIGVVCYRVFPFASKNELGFPWAGQELAII
jgi:hypothetical protein